ncbi:MAG: OsmC family protein [Odoribacteraceae bacterium]|jgi:uncharacterized OsmC-like protein|nr:OsmC family protein [Odoribacteraceae bacterium]
MTMIKAKYLGNMRVECVHQPSGATIITDAPVDNQGKGEAFSPTDLCATSLAACVMTIMGIYARDHDLDLSGTEIEITKRMAASPRRIGEIDVIFHMPDREFSDKEKAILERLARTCPVHLTLSEEVKQHFTFLWSK